MTAPTDEFLHRAGIAYFSMEIALRPEIHTYSGGLGVLAGDTARSAAELALPVVFTTLASLAGYFRQTIDADGAQREQPDWRDPERWCTALGESPYDVAEVRERCVITTHTPVEAGHDRFPWELATLRERGVSAVAGTSSTITTLRRGG